MRSRLSALRSWPIHRYEMLLKPSILFAVLVAQGAVAAAEPAEFYRFAPPGSTPAKPAATATATTTTTATPAPPPPAAARGAERPETWTSVGWLGDRDGHRGGRLQLDLLGGRYLALGVSATFLDLGDQVMSVHVPGTSATAYAAVTFQVAGPLYVRAQAGYGGALRANTTDTTTMGSTSPATASSTQLATSTTRLREAALYAHVELGASWAVFGGPVIQQMATPMAGTSATTAAFVVGLQHR